MLDSGESFFRSHDFKFDNTSFDSDTDSIGHRTNYFNIKVLNPNLLQGESLVGFLRLHVGNKLLEGSIFLRIETVLHVKFRRKENIILEEMIQNFKYRHPDIGTLKRPVATNQNDLLLNMKLTKSISKNSHRDSTKVKKSTIKAWIRSNKIKESVILGNQSHKINELDSLIHKRTGDRKSSTKLPFESLRVEKYIKLNVINKQIFTLNHDLKEKSTLILPFKLTLSEDFQVSHNHSLQLLHIINLDRLRALGEMPISSSHQNLIQRTLSDVEEGETYKTTHYLSAFYVPKKVYYQDDRYASNDQDPLLKYKSSKEFFQLENPIVFTVGRKRNTDVFKKYKTVFKFKYSKEHKYKSALARWCQCICLKTKISPLEFTKTGKFTICLETQFYGDFDDSINCVLLFWNGILSFFDYLDVIIVAKYRICDKSREDFKESIFEDRFKSKPILSQEIMKRKRSKRIISINRKDTESAHTNNSNLYSIINERKDYEGQEASDLAAEMKFDLILHSESIDLLGKRIIKQDQYSEMVHQIKIGKLARNHETIHSKVGTVKYYVNFYLSKSKFEFNEAVAQIPIVFEKFPKDYFKLSRDVPRRLDEFYSQITSSSSHFLLPSTSSQI